jgi:DNA-binding protein H-NS
VHSTEIVIVTPSLSKMTVEELVSTRQKIDGLLRTRVAAARKQLLERLDLIDSVFDEGSSPKRPGRRPGSQGKVAPKYRGPKGELWTGRGMKPRWMTVAMKDGAKPEDFLIAAAGRQGRKAFKARRNVGAKRGRKAT